MKTDRIDDILKRYFQPDAEPEDLFRHDALRFAQPLAGTRPGYLPWP